jgi:hypothetical protein
MRRAVSSKDLDGEEGLGAPIKGGGSPPSVNREASGELARSAFSVTDHGAVAVSFCPSDDLGRSSSLTTDCLFRSLSPSSSSSAISIKRLRRSELVEEDVEPDAACKEHAAESLVSLSSFGSVMEKAVS